jgi:hypothetical protein
MTNYQNGKIYKIEAHNGEEGDIYIGSTCKQYLSRRMDAHRSAFKYWKKGTSDKVTSYELFDKYDVENCTIILIENFPCNTIDELHSREAFYIKSMKCVNKCIPLRNYKEYYIDNKEDKKTYYKDNKDEKKEYSKIYYDKNKEKIKETIKEIILCDCGIEICYGSKSRHLKSKQHKKFMLCKEVETI